MPRSEGFLDPGAGPLANFAWDLRALREKAGTVPYRVLAKRAGFCASTLSVAASGARLPSLDVTLAYVQACGGDPETWRARWHELAVQHPPTHPGPNAQPGLQVAPPYDADEHDEHEGAAPGPGPGLVAQLEARPAPAVHVGTGERLRGRPTWRSGPRRRTVPVGRVAIVALTLVTALLSLRIASEGTRDTPATSPPPVSTTQGGTAMQQADALYVLIYGFTPVRSDTTDAIWDVGSCRNLSNAQSRLRAIAGQRQAEVNQLDALNVSKVPDHERLVTALRHAWLKSSQSDLAYANIAADLQSGCTSGAVATDPNYQQADAYAQAASVLKSEAAQLWNANADALRQLPLDESEI